MAVRIGAQVRDLRVEHQGVGLDARAVADRGPGALRVVARAVAVAVVAVVDARVGARLGAGADAAARGRGIDVGVHRRVGGDRHLALRLQRHAVAAEVGEAGVGHRDVGLDLGRGDRAAADVADVAVAARYRLRRDRDVAAGVDQAAGHPGLHVVGDGEPGRRQGERKAAAAAAFDARDREPVAGRRVDRAQRGAARAEQFVVAGRRARQVDVQLLARAAACRREFDAGLAEGMRAAAPGVAHVERRTARGRGELEPARVGVDDVVGDAVLQHAERLAFEGVLHLLAGVGLVGIQGDHRAAQDGGVIRLGGEVVAGDGERAARDAEDRQRLVVAARAADDDLLAAHEAVAGPALAVVAHDGVRVAGVADLGERHVAKRGVTGHQLHLVGVHGERVVRLVVGEPADGRAIGAIEHLVAVLEARAGLEAAVVVEVLAQEDAVVVHRQQRLGGLRRVVGVLHAVGVHLDAAEARRGRRDVGHRLAVAEAAEVDEVARIDDVRRRARVEGVRAVQRIEQRIVAADEQLDGEGVDDVDVIGRRVVQRRGVEACAAERCVPDRIAVDEAVRCIEADRRAGIHAAARREQAAGVAGAGAEVGAELDVVRIDHQHVVLATLVQRRVAGAAGGDRRVAVGVIDDDGAVALPGRARRSGSCRRRCSRRPRRAGRSRRAPSRW